MLKREIKLWWYRNCRVLSVGEARKLNLEFHRDAIKIECEHLNCNYFYKDIKNRQYRVK